MIWRAATIQPAEWQGLLIRDLTAGQGTRSSIARISVLPGATHVKSWSTRSDKFYYILSGQLHFLLDDAVHVLCEGDLCLVAQGQPFAYVNRTNAPVDLLLIHTPAFELSAEVFQEQVFGKPLIYHVAQRDEWEQAAHGPSYQPAAFAGEGFIHCCEADLVEFVGNHYYRGRTDMVLLQVDPGLVRASIRYEDHEGKGVFFPHVYGALNTDAVQQVVAFQPEADGTFRLPAGIGR